MRAILKHWSLAVARFFWPKKLQTLAVVLDALGPFGFARYAVRKRGSEVRIRILGQGITVRKGSPDFAVALSSLGKEFESATKYLSQDFTGTIVDAGGYIGTAAIKLSNLFPLATVITLEPSRENFRILEMNVSQIETIRAVRAALVGTNRSFVNIYDSEDGEWGFTPLASSSSGRNFSKIDEAPGCSLEDLSSEDIGLLKLDIEGERKIFLILEA